MADIRQATEHRAVLWREAPQQPEAAVLLLHGGRENGLGALREHNLARLRMRPFLTAVERSVRQHPVAVGEVVYRLRGWNGERADAAVDALAALAQLKAELGPVPVVLVGHSMGGRAALYAAGEPQVTGVVALAPWCVPGDPWRQFQGKHLIVLHDVSDRVTDPVASRAFAAAARAAGAEACAYQVHGSEHGMLRRARDWQAVSTRMVLGLLGLRPFPDDVSAALALRGEAPGGLDLRLPRRRELAGS
ncbi:alpha/beta fold hydrolase [Streptacidiphilus sp. EB103A]|uniref:alpha/beta fold hydrolase n=1 Tax=Streptacidiphilus sp. EB103A TaxID=3156275 RepID=UPI0035149909